MDLKARVYKNCEWNEDGQTDGQKTGHLCRILLAGGTKMLC